ncbi:MAG: ornithine cyclodeaminase family protein [Gemmatimonadota bacterium]|nr:ornithine cyclodeaminase family protein [Gemmatimonadota bacterium]MDE3171534.1 ornithine cyclodeaminase family protein [Gemmatimonadota bacterium]MDE3214843.1 ornithine cyclodeaminase family protein [Gemmatimonadota bacterium]
MRILTQSQVTRLLPMRECIPLMESALASLSRGEVVLPLRTVVRVPDGRGAFGMMPAYSAALPAFGAKVISVFPGNHARGVDSHQGAVLLFDREDGRIVALMDASSITAIRTAAVSAVATKLLAREDASTLALLGSGVQARTHLEAIALVRPIARVRVWSRTPAHAASFADWVRRTRDLEVAVCASAAAAARGADVLCTLTASREPVLDGGALAPGMHVNAVGASQPDARELASDAVARARIFADRRESLVHESADYLTPLREGLIAEDRVAAELGEILIGKARGRASGDEITLFKSLGLAVEDIAAACHVLERAERENIGLDVALGGERPS